MLLAYFAPYSPNFSGVKMILREEAGLIQLVKGVFASFYHALAIRELRLLVLAVQLSASRSTSEVECSALSKRPSSSACRTYKYG